MQRIQKKGTLKTWIAAEADADIENGWIVTKYCLISRINRRFKNTAHSTTADVYSCSNNRPPMLARCIWEHSKFCLWKMETVAAESFHFGSVSAYVYTWLWSEIVMRNTRKLVCVTFWRPWWLEQYHIIAIIFHHNHHHPHHQQQQQHSWSWITEQYLKLNTLQLNLNMLETKNSITVSLIMNWFPSLVFFFLCSFPSFFVVFRPFFTLLWEIFLCTVIWHGTIKLALIWIICGLHFPSLFIFPPLRSIALTSLGQNKKKTQIRISLNKRRNAPSGSYSIKRIRSARELWMARHITKHFDSLKNQSSNSR